ncbi:MAG: hypothetical protein QG567_2370 [Campylobacterota bacterium]|nr:hypothetical protein [Campylobacterota bacterium]
MTGLIRQIYTDPLTGYPNRSALIKDIEKFHDVLLYLINIDSFKDINDFYGNIAGDDMLIQITHFLDSFVKKNIEDGILYKLSGDEYGILLQKRGDGHELAKKLNDAFEKKDFYINDTDIKLNVSIGYSFTNKNLIANADMALKYAKTNRIDRACFEDVSFVANDHEKNITCTKKLKNAIMNDDILPFFQPIIDNLSGKIVKYEALIRMKDEDKILTPFYFLETSIKAKQYHKLTRIMIDKSFEYFKDKECGFSINISASDILRSETKDYLINKIKEFNIGNKLTIEILESEEFEKHDEIESFIQEIKSHGCLIAIDDFGSGYSNFQYIINLKVDFIKIDGSLIKNIIVDENSRVVVQTIANIAKELKVKTVAEFVHSKEVQNKILEIGIDYSQGYYFGEPKPTII